MSRVTIDSPPATDADAIFAVLASRPGALHEKWCAPSGATWTVARVDGAIVAVLAARVDEAAGAIMADQLECTWHDGRPTIEGVRGLLALEAGLHALADQQGFTVYSMVNEANERHLDALRKRGYERVPVVVYERKPRR